MGGGYSKDITFNGCGGDFVCVESESCIFEDCTLSYSSSDFKQSIWAFGDSYFDLICPHLINMGYNKALFDAYSGRNSKMALLSLRKMLGIVGVPNIIYWAMGMNDGDDGSVNVDWLEALNQLTSLCKKYGITLVLATIPNTPKIDNSFKNDVVRNSGFCFVDNNNIVGADENIYWNTGLLSKDNVHPTPQGARVLASALVDVIPGLKNN